MLLNVDDIWDLFESLTWYQLQWERASESFMCPSRLLYGLHTQSSYVNQPRVSYHHDSYYPHVVCSNFQSFDHDANSCPYYDIFDKCYAKFNTVIETLNEQYTHFVSEMKEYGLMYETNPGLPFFGPKANLYGEYGSLLTLEVVSTANTPLTNLD